MLVRDGEGLISDKKSYAFPSWNKDVTLAMARAFIEAFKDPLVQGFETALADLLKDDKVSDKLSHAADKFKNTVADLASKLCNEFTHHPYASDPYDARFRALWALWLDFGTLVSSSHLERAMTDVFGVIGITEEQKTSFVANGIPFPKTATRVSPKDALNKLVEKLVEKNQEKPHRSPKNANEIANEPEKIANEKTPQKAQKRLVKASNPSAKKTKATAFDSHDLEDGNGNEDSDDYNTVEQD